MMKGVLEFLTGDTEDAKLLRDNFVFKCIPMINPDGVINGNYRCSLAGCDLNRRYLDPDNMLTPEVCAIKKVLKDTQEHRGVLLYLDFHGHSRKKNVFLYGRDGKKGLNDKLVPRVIPKLLESLSNAFE